MHGRRVRRQQQMEALSQRMREVNQDNASLRGLVDSRNAEIMRLRQVIQNMGGSGALETLSSETPSLPPNAVLAHPEVRAAASCLGCTAVFHIAHCVQMIVRRIACSCADT